MMNDDFLHTLREPPRRDFAEDLYQQLSQLEEEKLMTIISSPMPAIDDKVVLRRTSRSFMTLAAAVFALIMLGTVLFYTGRENPSIVGNIPVSLHDLPPITTENAGQLTEIKRLGNGSLDQPVWSPDGKILAVAGARGVWLFDAADLSAKPRLLETRIGGGYGTQPRAAFSPDGRLIAANDGNTVRIWNAQTGEVAALLEGDGYPVTTLDFSPDSQFIATGSGIWDEEDSHYSVYIWDIKTGQARIIGQGQEYVMEVAFSPSRIRRTRLAANFDGGNALIWDVETGKVVVNIQQKTDLSIAGLSFMPNGIWLALAEEYGVGLWNADTGLRVGEAKLSAEMPLNVRDIVFGQNGTQVIFCTWNAGILVWDVVDQQFIDHPKLSSLPNISQISLNPDGKTLAIMTWDSRLTLWDYQSDTEIAAVPDDYMGSIFGLSLHGTQAAYGGGYQVELRDLESGNLLRKVDTRLDLLSTVLFSPDGEELIYSGSQTLRVRSTFAMERVGIRRVNVETGDSLPTLGSDFYAFSDLAFSSDGRWLAGANQGNNEVRLWDLSQQPPEDVGKQVLRTPKMTYNNVVFTPDGQSLVIATQEGGLLSWDLDTEQVRTLQENTTDRHTFDDNLAISPDGKTLAVAYDVIESGKKSFVRLVDFATGKILHTLEHDPPYGITDVAFSPDGALLVTADGNRMYLWKVQSGEQLFVSPSEVHAFTVDFDTDSRFIVTGGWDGLVRVWGVR